MWGQPKCSITFHWVMILVLLWVGGQPCGGAAEEPRVVPTDEGATGPLLGHVDSEQALIWYRPSEAGKYSLF